eukprot:1462467-Amphidinium_carterae.1
MFIIYVLICVQIAELIPRGYIDFFAISGARSRHNNDIHVHYYCAVWKNMCFIQSAIHFVRAVIDE